MTFRLSALLPLFLVAAGCVSVSRPSYLRPAAERSWPGTLAEANREAAIGNPQRADSLLARHAAAHPGTPQAHEALYWRAVFRLDPASGVWGARDALPLLEQYLANPEAPRRAEAGALRRVADQIVSLNRLASAAAQRIQQPAATPGDANAATRAAEARGENRAAADIQELEAEVQRLRAELAKANVELERIRKRLAEPPKKPPVG